MEKLISYRPGSAIDLANRIIRYYNYKEISDRRKNMLINKALLKYGYSNFTLEKLEYCSKYKFIIR